MAAALLTLFLAAAAAAYLSPPYRPLVTTLEGTVSGATDRSADGSLFFSFKGIRYAQPPVGPLRFEPPLRHPGWRGIVDALEHGNKCAQFEAFNSNSNNTRLGVEDCLFVNVYTRQLPGRESTLTGLPVMVYVHGGGFYLGSGDSDIYGPHYVMDEPVVLVTFNYRLGPFGFFTTHDAAAPGNYGMLDQVLLLQWVQDNIAAFGGDPGLVTIFGQSAGGASVSLLVLSPLGKGLFQHAISQSGASFSFFAASGKRRGLAVKLATQLGCLQPNSDALVDCVKRTPTQVLQDAWEAIGEHDNIGFRPRADRERNFPFLPDDARVLLATGNFNLVPWISGMTSLEGALFLPQQLPTEEFVNEIIDKNLTVWSSFLELIGESRFRILDCGADPIEETIRAINFFVGSGSVTIKALADILSDRIFVNEISEEIRLASAHAPVYKYVLDHMGPGRLTLGDNPPKPDNLPYPITELGVSHDADTLYLFTRANRDREQPGTPAYFMVRFMVNLWTNFARTGRPSSDVLPTPDWPIYTEKYQRHMRLNSHPALGERLFEERVNFWQTVRINEQWRHLLDRSPCF
ncbi:juvenile hormone esterase-like [Amphibalanus amphitrite]|uniref:juvenile hormone esterase-like n=2 Tax=Amphibalanus amphitrite TaxID=1232801 RepID=UPI001C90E666|nr:juvenile hormone esterase-like [Amphibalanus amphitrite]